MTSPRKFVIFAAVVAILISAPAMAHAAPSWWPIVPCGLTKPSAEAIKNGATLLADKYYEPCNQCRLIELGTNLVNLVIDVVVPVVGTFFFLLAGFWILLGARDPNLVRKGQGLFKDTAIGIAIILSAWLITNFILQTLAGDNNVSDSWNHIECKTGTLEDIVLGTLPETPTPAPGTSVTPGPGQTTPPPGGTKVCKAWVGSADNVNLCEGRAPSNNCGATTSACSQYVASINKNAGGPVSASFLKAIMANESLCNIRAASPANAYGLMQLLPATANQYKQYCGVSQTVTAAWLTNPANADASICISAQYFKALASPDSCGSDPRNMAAGYNGGPKACQTSTSCAGTSSCSGKAVQKWECVYDNTAKTVCNTGYQETRKYATGVLYCTNNPGF